MRFSICIANSWRVLERGLKLRGPRKTVGGAATPNNLPVEFYGELVSLCLYSKNRIKPATVPLTLTIRLPILINNVTC